MSLEALNSPSLVGAVTAGCYGLLPFAAKNPMLLNSAALPFVAIKGMNALSYGFSMYSVSRPGRYDGGASVKSEAGDSESSKPKTTKSSSGDMDAAQRGMEQMGTSKGRTLVPPAPWAFIIWAPIFMGELVMVTAPILAPGSVSPVVEQALREISGPYLLAQIFQALWAASFRPRYENGIYKYVSAANLAGIAASLSLCHGAFATTSNNSQRSLRSYSGLEYALYFLPLSLHFGWTTAASLVNLNGMYAMATTNDKNATARSVAMLGHASVVLATAIGAGITWTRKAPVYGGVICWALVAVAAGLKQRILANASNSKKNDDDNVVGIYGAERQRTLSLVGAAICASTSAAVHWLL
uniref:Uncharacterized protein n=1 Tax=Pseudo-nitzschia australis TaxID=44445 RepID=A0A7S4EFU3_9STRA|mmetsp:Transcript_25595/g.56105  ORF Transcript_25595/g.56105 Transcript_25595/m.56105 type:complete len:355 (-) Transcript_25595:150-1214(-)